MFHDLIYKLAPKQYETGQILLKEYSNANSLLFVEYGVVEVFFELEGDEFIVDNLYPGSVINYRSFFMEDLMHVTMRCKENTRILELSKKTFEHMREENPAFETRILMHQSQILRWNKKYPLDYIINVPEARRDRRISSELLKNMLRRRNIFKNIVFRRLSEVRERRKKPKLKEVKAACLARFGALDAKDVMKRTLVQLYKKSGDVLMRVKMDGEDIKYDRLMSAFDRVQKVLDLQQVTFEQLDQKVSKLQKRRQKREEHGGLDLRGSAPAYVKQNEKTYAAIQKFRQGMFIGASNATLNDVKSQFLQQVNNYKMNQLALDDDVQNQTSKIIAVRKIKIEQTIKGGIEDNMQRLEKLAQIAGKPKKNEVFLPFKSPVLAQREAEVKKQKRERRKLQKQGKLLVPPKDNLYSWEISSDSEEEKKTEQKKQQTQLGDAAAKQRPDLDAPKSRSQSSKPPTKRNHPAPRPSIDDAGSCSTSKEDAASSSTDSAASPHSSQLSEEFDKVMKHIKAKERTALDEENQAFADDELDATPRRATDENNNINRLVELAEDKARREEENGYTTKEEEEPREGKQGGAVVEQNEE